MRGKTIWDWLELAIIPATLFVGGSLLNRSEQKRERNIETDRQQEAAFQSYLDRMEGLLLDQRLTTIETEMYDAVHDVARTRTLNVLRSLDRNRKRFLLLFLLESKLIYTNGREPQNTPDISLLDADLTNTNLSHTDLKHANLSGADLSYADLSGADLHYADLKTAVLHDAILCDAILCSADLRDADLSGADLRGADLTCDAFLKKLVLSDMSVETVEPRDADLHDADISFADLTDAKITNEQLSTVKSLKKTIMPDGTTHD